MKAYTVVEYEVVDEAARTEFVPLMRASIAASGGRLLGTAGRKVVGAEGTPPKFVNIIEWNGLEQAAAYRKSAAATGLNAKRDKAIKIVRRYDVEAEAM